LRALRERVRAVEKAAELDLRIHEYAAELPEAGPIIRRQSIDLGRR
jgi:hypothetical protein